MISTKSIVFSIVLNLACLATPIFSQQIQVMTYNIKYDEPKDLENSWFKRRSDIVKMVKKYQPDILGIQEALLHQLTYLDSSLTDLKYIGAGRDDGRQKGEFCAILYNKEKFDVSNENVFWLAEDTNNPSIGWDAMLPRICVYGKFRDKITNASFWVFNTHFDHKGTEARLNSSAKIIEWMSIVNHEGLPIVLMGDLNSTPGDEGILLLKDFLDDSREISQSPFEGPEGTFNGFTPSIEKERIDYIFTKDFIVNAYKHLIDVLPDGHQISDHQPVMAKIQFWER